MRASVTGASLLTVVVAMGTLLAASSAYGQPSKVQTRKAIAMAKRGKCVEAIPVLEDAELADHRASVAVALADCYAQEGKLMEAVEIYRATTQEPITRDHSREDKRAIQSATDKLANAQARIPVVVLEFAREYNITKVAINDTVIKDYGEPVPQPPGVLLNLLVTAKGYEDFVRSFRLKEGEKLTVPVEMTKYVAPELEAKEEVEEKEQKDEWSGGRGWLGVKGHLYFLPQFAWRWFADGGKTVVAPGATVNWTVPMSAGNMAMGLSYTSYGWSDMPLRKKGADRYSWELVDSNLHSLVASAQWAWRVNLIESGKLSLMVGGGVGVGVLFAGQVTRTQAYPEDIKQVSPGEFRGTGDPYKFVRCKGPGDPWEAHEYCNSLDYDRTHYDYRELSWFSGGKVPTVYPWIELPRLGLAYNVNSSVSLDFDLSTTTGGAMMSLGMRVR